MSPFLRKVRTASGAMAVQIAVKGGRRAPDCEAPGLSPRRGRAGGPDGDPGDRPASYISPDQLALELVTIPPAAERFLAASADPARAGAVAESKRSRLLWEVLHGAYTRLGLGEAVGGDRAFEQMVLARVIELTSKAQVPRVLSDLGPEVSSPGFCGGWFIWLWLFLALAVGCPGGFVLGRGTHPDGAVWPDGARTSGPTRRWRPLAASMSSQGALAKG